MPSVAVHRFKTAISAATALGVLTVTDSSGLFPGANAWVTKDDMSVRYRVRILAVPSSTTVVVRRYPQSYDQESQTYFDDDKKPMLNYGFSDMTAVATTSHIDQEAQTAPIDPSYVKRVIP